MRVLFDQGGTAPAEPKIYHIIHVDRLPSVVADNGLWCDAKVVQRRPPGTAIGMNSIKQRRLNSPLTSHSDLHVGDCVPFYFCPRSVMLYVISQANHPELTYRGGQELIVHLEANLRRTVTWAEKHKLRWVFTSSNAGSNFFEDYSDSAHLDKIDWNAVRATDWRQCKEGKQAEFLVEQLFPWELVSRIGVPTRQVYYRAIEALAAAAYTPPVEIRPEWYY